MHRAVRVRVGGWGGGGSFFFWGGGLSGPGETTSLLLAVSPSAGYEPILRFIALMTSTQDRNAAIVWCVIGTYLERGTAPQDKFALSLSPTDRRSSGRPGAV